MARLTRRDCLNGTFAALAASRAQAAKTPSVSPGVIQLSEVFSPDRKSVV